MPTDLYLLGSGIRGTLQLTEETRQALAVCRVIYVLHNDPQVLRELSAFAEVRSFEDLYDGASERPPVYRRMSEILVAEAERGSGVAFVVHGHPLFLVSATEYTIELARSHGLRVTILPGVSSFDTLLADLELDLGYALQMYDSSTLIQGGFNVDPRVPVLIFQLATTLSTAVTRGAVETTVLQPLAQYLFKFYPSDHSCTVVHTGATILEPTEKVPTTVGGLATSSASLRFRPTLFIPPLPAD